MGWGGVEGFEFLSFAFQRVEVFFWPLLGLVDTMRAAKAKQVE